MGVFEEGWKAMQKEKHDENVRRANLDAERHTIAEGISGEFVSFMNTIQQYHNISPSVEGSHVILRVKTTSHALDITCDGADAFKVSDQQDGQAGQDVLNKEMMVRRVLEWWEKRGRG